MTCKGTCVRYKANKLFGINSRYENGQKRCSICEIFINWDGKHCPCMWLCTKNKTKGYTDKESIDGVAADKKNIGNCNLPRLTRKCPCSAIYTSVYTCRIQLQMFPHLTQEILLMNSILGIILSWDFIFFKFGLELFDWKFARSESMNVQIWNYLLFWEWNAWLGNSFGFIWDLVTGNWFSFFLF